MPKSFSLLIFLGCFLTCAPAQADLFKLEEKSEYSSRKIILVLMEDFDKNKCQFRNAKALVIGDFDPSYFFRFKVNKDCLDAFVSKYSLSVPAKDKNNFILLNNLKRNWWKPQDLEDFVYYTSQKKASDNNMYYLMYDAGLETAYLYLQDF